MSTVKSPDFERLEALNAQIDVWVDEEEFDWIDNGTFKLTDSAQEYVRVLFLDDFCTAEADSTWRRALSPSVSPNMRAPIRAIAAGDGGPEEPLDQEEIGRLWSALFWAKLLRSMIQRKGTDCYFRRLDHVVTYLQNNLPQPERRARKTKLAVIYLLELAAASIGYEGLGFAQRAHDVTKSVREGSKANRLSGEFYDLWARYNMGIAYFHQAHYRESVREFNWIIQKMQQLEKKHGELPLYFVQRKSADLLYFPSVRYRADVQLKLQLAYHALDTLDKHFWHRSTAPAPCQDVRAKLIQVEAYQQMELPVHSWDLLKVLCNEPALFKTDLGFGEDCNIPVVKFGDTWLNAKVRLLGLLIDDHLLKLEDLIEKEGRANERGKHVVAAYFERLGKVLSTSYFEAVRHDEPDRQGYFEQVARLLGLLSTARTIWKNDECLARQLGQSGLWIYEDQRHNLLPLVNESSARARKVCQTCSKEQITLERLGPDHYERFTDDVLKFLDDRAVDEDLRSDKENFIKELIRLERVSREDLRVHDLELRYRSSKVTDQSQPAYWSCRYCFSGRVVNKVKMAAFADLLPCVQSGGNETSLNAVDYEKVMSDWHDRSLHSLRDHSVQQPMVNSLRFVGLQRWNSTSPAQGRSMGGGYLLYRTNDKGHIDLGIAIDPGFDFVRNLFRMGFSLADIDIVLLSHAHADHVRDFESMVLLLYDLAKKTRQKKRLHVILTLGIYRRLSYIIEDPSFRLHIEPYVIDIEKEIDPTFFETLSTGQSGVSFRFVSTKNTHPLRYRALLPKETGKIPDVAIWPTRAYHDDQSGFSDSFGFRLDLAAQGASRRVFGYTGDTKWVYPKIEDPSGKPRRRIIEDVAKQYVDCDAVLIHLGSLIDRDKADDQFRFEGYVPKNGISENCEDLVRRKNHPYLPGTLRLLSTLDHSRRRHGKKGNPLVLVSEFGEELRGGIRVDLNDRLAKTYRDSFQFLPVDVGMDVLLWRGETGQIGKGQRDAREAPAHKVPSVLCAQCNKYVELDRARFERFGEDEALFCVCATCQKGTPWNVLQDRLHHLYHVGREPVSASDSTEG